MANSFKILTHTYSQEKIKSYAEKAANETGKDFVRANNIESHNNSLDNKTPSIIKRILFFLFNTRPYLGFLVSVLIPTLIMLPFSLKDFAHGGFIFLFLGAFIGFVAGSFIFPKLIKNCPLCKSFGKCRSIFSYTISFNEHTEKRRNNNGAILNVLVREEFNLKVMECTKCKGRKLELLMEKKESLL